ncbi:hypothetical protein [Enterococcus faecalis]|uniref:hypothetical protein n=1 Tax=Enterococcus faecalis TaxID=1351 RepID=UPI0034CF2200
MGDMGEFWNDMKPILKEKRQSHVKKMGNSALKNVETLGYPYKHYEANHQFAIETPIGFIDYFGTTGTWVVRKGQDRGRGLHSLRKYVAEGLK